MKFRSLFIKGFGIFDESISPEHRFFRFEPNEINVILGRNERGKSTLMEAAVDTLFGISDKRKELRVPWGEHSEFASILEFSIKNRLFKIERNFQNHQTRLTEIIGNKEKTIFKGKANPKGSGKETKRFRDKLEELGIPSRDTLSLLAFVRKMEMEQGIVSEIRRIITGSGRNDYSSVIDSLKNDYFQITRIDPWGARNKTKPRELERLIEEEGRLYARYKKSKDEHNSSLKAEEEVRALEKEISDLEISIKDDKYIITQLKDSIQVNNDYKHIKEKISELITKKESILKKQNELSLLQQEIQDQYTLFIDFEGNVTELCRELVRTRDLIDKIEHDKASLYQSIFHLEQEKEAWDKKISEKYSDFANLKNSFLEQLNDYIWLLQDGTKDINFYREKKRAIEDLEDRLSAKTGKIELPDNFHHLLHAYSEKEKEARVEQMRLKTLLEERKNKEKEVEEVQEALKKEFPDFDILPDDFEETIKDIIKFRKDKTEISSQIETAENELQQINGRMNSLLNYAIPGITILIFFIAGLLFSNLITFFATLEGMTLSILLGLIAGIVFAWIRFKPHFIEKNQTEALIEILKQKSSSAEPSLSLPPGLKRFGSLNELLETYSRYKKAVLDLETLKNSLSKMENEASLTSKIEEIEKEISFEVKSFGLPAGVKPQSLINNFDKVQKLKDDLKALRDNLCGRFSSLPEKGDLPEIPDELMEKMKNRTQFEVKYPFIEQVTDLLKLKTDFGDFLKIKEKIKEIETRIYQISQSMAETEELEKHKQDEKHLLDSLDVLIKKFGDDPNLIEEKYNSFISNSQKIENMTSWLKNEEDPSKLDDLVNQLTAEGGILQFRMNQIMDKSPTLKSFADRDPHMAALQLKKMENDIEKKYRVHAEKKDKINILKYRLEQLRKSSDDPETLWEETCSVREEIERLKNLSNAYQIAVECLDESVDEFYSTYHESLQQGISSIFNEMTDNRYDRVLLDNKFDLLIQGGISQDVENIDKDQLSTGTRDQLYFAVRLALTESLSDRISLPFLLDDPFVFFDSDRLDTAKDILHRIADKHQIIIFSHSNDYSDWGRVVANLDEIYEKRM